MPQTKTICPDKNKKLKGFALSECLLCRKKVPRPCISKKSFTK